MDTLNVSRQGKLVLIIGPSGVGKSVILKELRKRHPELHFPRSATTRTRRPREGTELYHFVTDQEFDRLIAEGRLLERATVHESARYGTLIDEIIPAIEQGKTVVREVDVQGFESIRTHPLFSGSTAPYTLQSMFILPESREQLLAHIAKRAPMERAELLHRMESMDRELSFAKFCNAQVTNHEGEMEETIREMEELL